MCDTIAAVEKGGVWFAKNSDREPGEAQLVEVRDRKRGGARLSTTYLTIDQAKVTNAIVISRPAWMWGAEMGANEHGLAIGNEAVFTRVPVDDVGLTGMDLVRLALERCACADEALDLIAWMIDRHGQGGAAGYRDKRFRYHNAFLIADPAGAWLLETAGRFWAAERVRGVRTTSNVLTIGADYTRLGPGTIAGDFRKTYGDPAMGFLSGGDVRRACTAKTLGTNIDLRAMRAALRDHAGATPRSGLRMTMPCAHASWLPTRHAGQTTGSMISRLERGGSSHWLTGTSAPCISVFKRVGFDRVASGNLWWRAEALHRTVLRDYALRRATFEPDRAALEERALTEDVWREHEQATIEWRARAEREPAPRASAFDLYWRLQSWRDGVA